MPNTVLLLDWMQQFIDNKEAEGLSKSRLGHLKNLTNKLQMYRGGTARLKDATKVFCTGFLSFLSTTPFGGTLTKPEDTKPKEPQPLSKKTATVYYKTFVSALNEAVIQDIIESNPTAKIGKEKKKLIKDEGSTRTYLTLDEVKALIETQCPDDEVKRAFIFACFCGLRISDIRKLTWAEVRQEGQQLVIETLMKKTGKSLLLPVSQLAAQWMPERGTANASAPVFSKLPCATTASKDIRAWAQKAGITKNVVFHTSRHTFATMLLTLGADLYTTSKLLGHQDLKTTQIYAEIVNQKKTDAVNLFNHLLDK